MSQRIGLIPSYVGLGYESCDGDGYSFNVGSHWCDGFGDGVSNCGWMLEGTPTGLANDWADCKGTDDANGR